ncbi:MAG: SCO family protein [Rhodospirillales bacterium]|jgi:protein SCO1/2|nr:SCO family protein [Rhodospirillales bacterium]|tara:strand:- start:818 stop:1480 length:663 start_codon:yes stop_codon:yes gene_type:complete
MNEGRFPTAFVALVIVLAVFPLGGLYSTPAWAHEAGQSGPVSQSANRGPFSLVDHRGYDVTDKDFLGKFMLVYFGYTHCPDLCPIDLRVMIEAIQILGEKGEKVQPILITVDPERDTVEVMAAYVRRFDPRLIGLTGAREHVAAAAKRYRVRRMKFFPLELDDADESQIGANQDNLRYVVDHGASIYLVGPDGGGLSRYPNGMAAEEIAEDIERFIDGPQ